MEFKVVIGQQKYFLQAVVADHLHELDLFNQNLLPRDSFRRHPFATGSDCIYFAFLSWVSFAELPIKRLIHALVIFIWFRIIPIHTFFTPLGVFRARMGRIFELVQRLVNKPIADVGDLFFDGVLIVDIIVLQPEALVPLLDQFIPSPLLLKGAYELLEVGLFLIAQI